MSPIERKSIRIENDQIIGDGSGTDAGRTYKYLCDEYYLIPTLEKHGLGPEELAERRVIEGPKVFDARDSGIWRNSHSISYSKKKGLGFYPKWRIGYWQKI